MELANFSFCQGDECDAGKLETLVDRGNVLLVAADAIERFGEHDVEVPGVYILEERQHVWSHLERAAADSGIRVSLGDAPTFGE